MTKDQFITKEIAVWGESYIYDLIDRGYEPVELHDRMGNVKWSWRLTQPRQYAMMAHGSISQVQLLPFLAEDSRL